MNPPIEKIAPFKAEEYFGRTTSTILQDYVLSDNGERSNRGWLLLDLNCEGDLPTILERRVDWLRFEGVQNPRALAVLGYFYSG